MPFNRTDAPNAIYLARPLTETGFFSSKHYEPVHTQAVRDKTVIFHDDLPGRRGSGVDSDPANPRFNTEESPITTGSPW